jgi:sugar/nucleoside kinase (ribokinase family)
MVDAICMGELLISFVPSAADTNLLTVFQKAPDGAPANVAVDLTRPGVESAPLAPERLFALCRFANGAGALAMTRRGSIPALPTRAKTMALVEPSPIPSVREVAP